MAGFVKLFESMLDSTVWLENDATRIVWITMLAMANAEGYVGASVPGLAKRAGVDRAATETALAKFMAPDPDSRSKENEGRRIKESDGGWTLLNYRKYRDKRHLEVRRQQYRDSKRRCRDKRAIQSFDETAGNFAPMSVYEEDK